MLKAPKLTNHQRGLTLVELVTAIVIIAIALVGANNAIAVLISDAYEPVLRQQAIYIASSYIEEINSKAYRDPTTGVICGGATPASRSNYDDVCDYDNLTDTGAHDQNGTLITGLENFDVAVNVTQTQIAFTTNVLQTDVVVTYGQNNDTVSLTAYRAEY